MTIIDGFDAPSDIAPRLSQIITDAMRRKGRDCYIFTARDMDVMPCRSCGACGFKSPGKCVISDDIHGIMRAVAVSTTLVYLTPVRFGGYTSQLKKIADRMMPIGMPYYIVRDGHMLHPMRYSVNTLIGIGLIEADISGQTESFKLHIERNAMNMVCTKHQCMVGSATTIEPLVHSALQEE